MTFADRIEGELASLIIKKLEERSQNSKRAWLNKQRYGEMFEDREDAIAEFGPAVEIEDLEEKKFLCVEHTHELVHFDDDKLDEALEKLCEKIEDYYIKIVKDMRFGISKKYNLRYREKPIKIKMCYRYFEVTYYLNFYNW